jgi:uncharacterized protein (TIGR03067 family)
MSAPLPTTSPAVRFGSTHRGLLLAALLAVMGLMALLQPIQGKQPEGAKGAKTEKGSDEPPAAEATADETAAEKETAKLDPAADEAAARAKSDGAARRELRDLAELAFEETMGFYETGDALPTEVYRWSLVWLHYELELSTDDEQKAIATQAHLDRMITLAQAGLWRSRELEFYVAEAEWLVDRAEPSATFAATIAGRKALEGQWDVVSIEEEGAKQTRPDIKAITIAGRRAIFEHRLGTAKALLTIEPTAEPATIDIFGLNEDFPFGGLGIYKLDGDTLTICWVSSGERPKEFSTAAGDKTLLVVLKKAR